jgi:osmotically-inducible protein OsmY
MSGADPSDAELVDRVRNAVAIPWDVEVVAQDGAVVLFGRVPRYLAEDLTARVARVPGVQAVVDRLTPVDLVAPGRPAGPPDPP